VVARRVDTPDTHPAAAELAAAAVAVVVHCALAWEAAEASISSLGSRATCAAFEGLDRAYAAAVAAVVARKPHTRRQRKARRWSVGCRWVIRSLLCRVLEGCLSSMCGCCWGGFGPGSHRRVEGQRRTLRLLVGVWAFGLRPRAGVVVAGLECLQG
jgi:hypothetical protein